MFWSVNRVKQCGPVTRSSVDIHQTASVHTNMHDLQARAGVQRSLAAILVRMLGSENAASTLQGFAATAEGLILRIHMLQSSLLTR
jgi:hypothetical protein